MIFLLYLISNKVNGKLYVGQTGGSLELRWSGHVNESRCRASTYIAKAIKRYGPQSFEIEQIGEASNIDGIDSIEMAAIAFFRTTDHSIGYNLSNGGRGRASVLPSTRQKLRAANLGKHHTAESRRKMSIARKGTRTRFWTDEQRAALSVLRKSRPDLISQCSALGRSLTGTTLSAEHRAKLCKPKRRTNG